MSGVIWLTDLEGAARRSPSAQAIKRALRSFDLLWCLSRPQTTDLKELLGPAHPPIEFLSFGVDTGFFSVAPLPQRECILSVGGDRDRDTQTLFTALGRIRAERPDADILVQSASTLPPPEGVTVVPHLSHAELREAYRRSSLVVLATRANKHVSGMTVGLEAMSTGRPVVATHTPGFDDYLEDGVTGCFAETGDGIGLAKVALEILNQPNVHTTMARQAREYCVAEHSTAAMAEDVATLIRETIERRDSPEPLVRLA
jgi:glycosyltransferase involved in cell wall biosynthesis